MRQPTHFVDASSSKKVLRSNKAIYGLKQSGKEWNSKLDSVLRQMNFVPCDNEPSFCKAFKNNDLVIIAVYVDDLIIGCSNIALVHDAKRQIADNFPRNGNRA